MLCESIKCLSNKQTNNRPSFRRRKCWDFVKNSHDIQLFMYQFASYFHERGPSGFYSRIKSGIFIYLKENVGNQSYFWHRFSTEWHLLNEIMIKITEFCEQNLPWTDLQTTSRLPLTNQAQPFSPRLTVTSPALAKVKT